MAKKSGDPVAQSLAGMANVGNPRVPMGQGPYPWTNASAAPSKNTKRVAKKNSKSAAQADAGTATHRKGILMPGASYRITARWQPPVSPEAAATQANGRIVKSMPGSKGNFFDDAHGS